MENMAQETRYSPMRPPSILGSLQNAHLVCGSALIGILMAAIYFQQVAKLVTHWWQILRPFTTLVPVFAAYLVWGKREKRFFR